MSKRQMAYTLVLSAVLSCGLGDVASACGGHYGGFGCAGYITTDRQIPYFSEHPPVYYSHVVPRTYGYSPYAYRVNMHAYRVNVQTRRSRPLVLKNHHIQKGSKAVADKATDKTASNTRPVESLMVKPLVIENPYVTDAGSIAGK